MTHLARFFAACTIGLLALTLCKTATAATYRVRADGVVLKDGAPFFPFGLFSKSPDQKQLMADLTLIADAGFNTVLSGVYATNDLTAYLDEARRRGVAVISEADSRNISSSTLLPIVNRSKNHPAMLGYYIMDDAHDYVSTVQLRQKHNDIKAAAPNLLTFMADYDHTAFGPFMGIADLSGPYRYPVRTATAPLELVDRTYAEATKCNCAVYAIPQSFAWSGNRVPNPVEERNMVYQALAHNVKGVIFYAFSGEGYLPDSPALWNEIKKLVPELKAMGEVILSGAYTRAQTGKANVFSAYWKVGSSYTVVVVNSQASEQSGVSVALPADASGSLTPMFSDRPQGLSWSGGRITGTVKALDVHVYRIGAAPSTGMDAGVPGLMPTMDAGRVGTGGTNTSDTNTGTVGGRGMDSNQGGNAGEAAGGNAGRAWGDGTTNHEVDRMAASGCSCAVLGQNSDESDAPIVLLLVGAAALRTFRVRRRRT